MYNRKGRLTRPVFSLNKIIMHAKKKLFATHFKKKIFRKAESGRNPLSMAHPIGFKPVTFASGVQRLTFL